MNGDGDDDPELQLALALSMAEVRERAREAGGMSRGGLIWVVSLRDMFMWCQHVYITTT